MAKVPNAVETFPKISIAWVWRTNITDDRHTDSRRSLKIAHISLNVSIHYPPKIRTALWLWYIERSTFNCHFVEFCTGVTRNSGALGQIAYPSRALPHLSLPFLYLTLPPFPLPPSSSHSSLHLPFLPYPFTCFLPLFTIHNPFLLLPYLPSTLNG